VGVLGVAGPWWDRLRITAPELEKSIRPADSSPLWLLDATEANVAAWVGLCTAVAEYLAAGPERIWARLAEVGRQTREALAGLPGIVTTAAGTLRAPRDMTEPLLRVSPHIDCTAEDLDRLRQALLELG
jgi:pyridoxal 5-phosphate dependent beta-lyase